MGSTSMSVIVVPQQFPFISKLVYYGDGQWTDGGMPEVSWRNATTLRIGPRNVRVLGPAWVDDQSQ